MPNTRWNSAEGRFMLGQLALAAQFQADYDSKRMQDMMRATFEAGGHRGNDPFGYRSDYTNKRRELVVVPEEASVVRRAFELLAKLPFSEVADALNREGAQHRSHRAWTSNAVKDLWRRREVYRGNVTTRRGAEVREGNHDAILDEDAFREAVAGVMNRKRCKGKRPPTSKRLYLLRGLVYCSCGTRMHGDARLARGQAWRYYLCPVAEGRRAAYGPDGELLECDARRVPADVAEAFVVEELRSLLVPDEAITAAREELARRLRAPQPGTADRERERLETRLKRLRDLFGWGDLSEADYRRQVVDVREQLAQLPGSDGRLVAFDDYRRRAAEMRSFAEMVDAASGDKLQELIPWLIERVETHDRHVVRVVPTEPARPFFADELRGAWRPRTDSNRRRAP